MSSTHSHSNYDLLQQVMNTPEGEDLEFHIRGVVTNWVGNVLPGRFASRYDDPEFMRNVLHMVVSRRQPIQPMGWPTQEPSAPLEQWRDEDNSYVPGWLPHGPQDGTGTASDTRVDRVRDVIDGVGRVGIDEATLEPTGAEPPSDLEPLPYVEGIQNLHIDTTDRGSSSGAPSDRSSLHSRRKPCAARHAGKYACKMLGCKKYGEPQLYSRLREHIALHFKRLRTRCPSCRNVYYQSRSCGIHHRKAHGSAMPTPSDKGSGTSVAGSELEEDQEALAAEYIVGRREWVEDS